MTADWKDTFRVEREHFATTDYWKTLKETDNGKVSFDVAPSVIYGDVNRDGEVTTFDAALTYAYVNKKLKFTEVQQKAADINGDGEVTTFDAALIYAYVNKKISQFPIEKK